ncbi:hypothetical protein E3T28_16660 [Cryobacterium sinapicolor]|uniref:Uncharacterized protein n=1 Tax=Cryobacterium sinapicolor TaxID=1259236 RepID=A0ABY2IVS1_9MICO|nr:hypothetical protein [Cryobacterium sinapicolor]TFC93436.1 hypothetical protein E3T28_16660 [Cryobacterium sinapicolor]
MSRAARGRFTVLEPSFHDLARTNYDVDRNRRSVAGTERDALAALKAVLLEAEHARVGSAVLGM